MEAGKYSQSFKLTYEDNGNKLAFGSIYYAEIEVVEKVKINPKEIADKNLKNDDFIPQEYSENAKRIMEIGISDKKLIVNTLKEVNNDFSKAIERIFDDINSK